MNRVVEVLSIQLKKYFIIQILPLNTETVKSALIIMKPALAVVSLVGTDQSATNILHLLQNLQPRIHVITIGTQQEKERFLKFYEDQYFTNIIRPADNLIVQDKIADLLQIHPEDLTEIQTESSNKKRILVVDDNTTALRSVQGMLKDTYEVILVNSGIKAMTAIGKKRPDLILLDYEMPVCDGKQTLEMLRSDPTLFSIPVIFLTGVADRKHVQAIMSLQPQGYLLKPPIKEDLLEAIHKVL